MSDWHETYTSNFIEKYHICMTLITVYLRKNTVFLNKLGKYLKPFKNN